MKRKEQEFIETVWNYYNEHGRHNLPWRAPSHHKPYNILVSEMMLQQTQVERVIPKYRSFLQKWSSARQLAAAPLGDVLRAWQGLGYNRRAKLLHRCAVNVYENHSGRFPRNYVTLITLPGVGPYTAGAVMAFAYNIAVPIIETNIRTVYLYHFFSNSTDVTDTEITQSVERTLDHERPREWYWALMDYGAYLKRTHGNLNSKSKLYTKQSPFAGSDRQIRGAILRTLSNPHSACTRLQLHEALAQFEDVRIDVQLRRLVDEELLTYFRGRYYLPQ